MADLIDSSAAGGPAAAAAQFGLQQLDKSISYFQQKNLNRQAQANTIKNMQLAHNLNYRAAVDQTNAMRMAGINPALATGGNFNASGVSNPAGVASAAPHGVAPDMAASLLAGKQIALLDAERKSMQASANQMNTQAEKNRQDVQESASRIDVNKQNIAESQSRVELNAVQQENLVQLTQKFGTEQLLLGNEYKRALTEDTVAHHALMDYCERRIASSSNETERDFWSAFKAIGRRGKFDAGALMSMNLFSSSWNNLEEYEKEIGARAIQKQIQSLQLDDDSFLDVLAHAPAADVSRLLSQASEALENAKFRKAYREDLMPSEKSSLDENVRVQKHNDPAGMLKDGDYVGFGVYGLGQLLRFGGDVIKARQFGKGSALSDPRGKQPNGAPKSSVKQPEAGKTIDGKIPPRLDTRSDTAVKQSVAARLGSTRTDALYDEFLKSGYRSKTGNNSFSEWLANVKRIGR